MLAVRSIHLLLGAALVGFLAPFPFAKRTAEADGFALRPDILAVQDIRPGMSGYGLTVFQGTRPERFDIEVIDVIRNFRPRQDMILVKTKHPRLEVAKVVAGMSGSPIYIGGKMVGAYAYGWTFPAESVAGVTPIRHMLDDLARPVPDMVDGVPLRVLPQKSAAKSMGQAQNRYEGETGAYDLSKHALQMSRGKSRSPSDKVALMPVATPLLMGGMTSGSVDYARQLLAPLGLEPLEAGGTGSLDPRAPDRFEDGGAIAVELVRGDVAVVGLGTVTRVEGDKLVAFGHPMFEAGVTALPTAVARVAWFMATGMRSFKMGAPVQRVGALVNDRQSSIVVSQSAKAPTIPVSVSLKGLPGALAASWKFEVAHDKFLTPSFVSLALGSAVQAVANEHQDVTWYAKSALQIKGHGSLAIDDFGVAVGGTPEAADFARSNLVRALGSVLNNPWQPAQIEGVSLELELKFAREILRLRGAELLTPEVDAGQAAQVRLTFLPFAGQPLTRVVSVPIPANLAGRDVTLEFGPGYLEEREKPAPENLQDLVRNFREPTYPPRSVVATFNSGESAVSFRGRVAKNLPPGVLDAIRPSGSSIAPDAFATAERHAFDLGQFMVGKDRVTVSVRRVLR